MTKKKLSDFGPEIKKRLIDKNMTSTELAKTLSVKPEYLSYILHGKRPGRKYIERIKKILEL